MNGDPRYNALMEEVCVQHGWCGGRVGEKSLHVDDLIPASGPVSADRFVAWLLLADGVDQASEPGNWRCHIEQLRDAFIRHMGAEIVDTSALKWNVH